MGETNKKKQDYFTERCIEDVERVLLGLKRGDIIPVELGSWEADFSIPLSEWGEVRTPQHGVRIKTAKIFSYYYGKEWTRRKKTFFWALRHPLKISLLIRGWKERNDE